MNTTTATDWPTSLQGFVEALDRFGYKSIIRDRIAYLFHGGAGRHCLATEVDNGRWIGRGPFVWSPHSTQYGPDSFYNDNWRDLILPPWRDVSAELSAERVMEFRQVMRACYCYQGVDRCDFCTSTRRPDRYRNDYATLGAAQAMLDAQGWRAVASHRWEKGDKWATIHGIGSQAGMPTLYEVCYGRHGQQPLFDEVTVRP